MTRLGSLSKGEAQQLWNSFLIFLVLCIFSVVVSIILITNLHFRSPPPPKFKQLFEEREVQSTLPPMDKQQLSQIFVMDQIDGRLIEYIRIHHLAKPSDQPYNLSNNGGFHSNGYSEIVLKMFDSKKNGTFIEVGAYDGEAASNTLHLEELGWKGLLIECNPLLLPKLKLKNRKAWIADVCLSPSNTPELLNFSTPVDWPASAKLGAELNEQEMKKYGIDWIANKTWLYFQLPCFPLYSIIKAVGEFEEINFLSLDVEGVEISILQHFPFDKIKIKVIIVEVHTFTEAEKKDLEKFMITKGYYLHMKMGIDHVYALENYKTL